MMVEVRGGSPIRPQLRRHTISGAGTPIASHSMVTVSPSSTVSSPGGARVTVGIADNINIIAKPTNNAE